MTNKTETASFEGISLHSASFEGIFKACIFLPQLNNILGKISYNTAILVIFLILMDPDLFEPRIFLCVSLFYRNKT